MTELPMSLWMVFVGFAIPLMALVMSCVRYGLFIEAAREAADSAADAQYYLDDGTSPGQGAVAMAISTANKVAAAFPGISINGQDGSSLTNGVNCYIVVTPISSTGTSTVYGPNTCLTSPADLTKNIYQIRVDVLGQIQPLFSGWSGGFEMPGVNTPLPVAVSNLRVYENGPGLSIYTSSNPTNIFTMIATRLANADKITPYRTRAKLIDHSKESQINYI